MSRDLVFTIIALGSVAAGFLAWRIAMRQHRDQLIGIEANMPARFPMWVYFIVSLCIALLSFVVGQVWPGAGMLVLLGLMGLWSAVAGGLRGRRMGRD